MLSFFNYLKNKMLGKPLAKPVDSVNLDLVSERLQDLAARQKAHQTEINKKLHDVEKMDPTYAKQNYFKDRAPEKKKIPKDRSLIDKGLKSPPQIITNRFVWRTAINRENNEFYKTGADKSVFIKDFIQALALLIKYGEQNAGTIGKEEMKKLKKIKDNLSDPNIEITTQIALHDYIIRNLQLANQVCSRIQAQTRPVLTSSQATKPPEPPQPQPPKLTPI